MEPVTRYKVESIGIREVEPLDRMASFREKKVFKELDSSHIRETRFFRG